MGRLNSILSPDDLKKGELVEPGWHPAESYSYEESEASDEAKNPGSLNIKIGFKIIDGNAKGVIVNRLFNETALGFGKNLWAVYQLPYDKDKGYKITADALEAKVRDRVKLMIYIKRGKSNKGNEFNDVQDFRPFSS